jgi:predicted acetyltransferase
MDQRTSAAAAADEVQEYTRWREDHDGATKRPFRLWDAIAKHDMPHRYYAIERNALNGALLEAAWAKVGTSIEVYDCRTARHIATFTRKTTGQISRFIRE